ncbi:MAG TPA: acyltransferase family protein [Baekduia sp.]|nr:acyltransferase family protein [Baekduia sp.]
MDGSGFRLDIQGLRGFALVLVLCTHAEVPGMSGGFVGLDVFYVLSGFLITGLILHEVDRTGTVSLVRFYARRARRLLPLAVTVLAAIFVGSLLLFGPVRAYKVAGDMLAATLYFANWRFIAQSTDYFAFDDASKTPVQHYWSLSVEEQFYLLWPVLILGALWLARWRRWSLRTVLGVLLTVLGLASLAYGVWFSGVAPRQSYFSTLARAWELALGCGLALALPAVIRLPRGVSWLMTAGGLAVLVATTLTLSGATPYPGWWALAPTLASVAIIVAGTAVTASAPVRLLCVRPLQDLGRISYAWYLWHWPALVFAAAAFGPLTPAQKVAVTLASWVPTIITHHLIEERFRRSAVLARRPRLAVSFGVACTATAVLLAVLLTGLRGAVPTASADAAPGARMLDRGETLQRTAKAVRPNLRHAEEDRGRAFSDGCHLKGTRRVSSPDCVYGSRGSRKTVVNVGDSHGLMYAPALMKLARHRGWRLVSLTKAGCTVAEVDLDDRCDAWRENTLRRIERERPSVVVVSSGTNDGDRYAVRRDGKRLSRAASEPLLERGFRQTLQRLRRTGAKVVVIRDIAHARHDVIDCVADHLKHLAKCAVVPHRSSARAFDAKGAHGLRGVRVVDPLLKLCPVQPEGGRRCPAVIGNVLVYRNHYHLTATFARTLAPWLGRHLPKVRAR